MKREYQPPPEVLALIRQKQRLGAEAAVSGPLRQADSAERAAAGASGTEPIDTELLAELLTALDDAFSEAGTTASAADRAEMVARTYADIVEMAHDSPSRRMGAKMARQIFFRTALLFKPNR